LIYNIQMKVFKKEYTTRRNETSTFNESFQELLKAYRIKDKYTEINLVASWGKLMGPAIANRTSDIYISRKKLYVTLTSAPLKQELSYNKNKIIEIVRKEFGEEVIEDIVIK
jgi:predicted solute-binding protein